MYEKYHVRELENPKYGGSQKSYIWKGGIKIIFMKKMYKTQSAKSPTHPHKTPSKSPPIFTVR